LLYHLSIRGTECPRSRLGGIRRGRRVPLRPPPALDPGGRVGQISLAPDIARRKRFGQLMPAVSRARPASSAAPMNESPPTSAAMPQPTPSLPAYGRPEPGKCANAIDATP
jgi:hypothetical protein